MDSTVKPLSSSVRVRTHTDKSRPAVERGGIRSSIIPGCRAGSVQDASSCSCSYGIARFCVVCLVLASLHIVQAPCRPRFEHHQRNFPGRPVVQGYSDDVSQC